MEVWRKRGRFQNVGIEQKGINRVRTRCIGTNEGVGCEDIGFGYLVKQVAGIGEGTIGRKGGEGEDAGCDEVIIENASGD